MALSRRTGARFQGAIWPGFVDAMTGLLLVLMFVLTIFMMVQFVLREEISGQETQLDALSTEVSALPCTRAGAGPQRHAARARWRAHHDLGRCARAAGTAGRPDREPARAECRADAGLADRAGPHRQFRGTGGGPVVGSGNGADAHCRAGRPSRRIAE